MKLLAFGLVLLSFLQSFATSDYQGKVFTDLIISLCRIKYSTNQQTYLNCEFDSEH
jgi:hypothetical protein